MDTHSHTPTYRYGHTHTCTYALKYMLLATCCYTHSLAEVSLQMQHFCTVSSSKKVGLLFMCVCDGRDRGDLIHTKMLIMQQQQEVVLSLGRWRVWGTKINSQHQTSNLDGSVRGGERRMWWWVTFASYNWLRFCFPLCRLCSCVVEFLGFWCYGDHHCSC